MRRVSEQFHRERGHPLPLRRGREAGRAPRRRRRSSTSRRRCSPSPGSRPRADMPGRVLHEGLDLEVPGRAWRPTRRAAAAPRRAAQDAAANPEIVERLHSLGYVGDAARQRRRSGRTQSRAEVAASLAPGRPQPRRDALRAAGSYRGVGRRPYRELVEAGTQRRHAAHQPGRRPGRAGPLRRGAEAARRARIEIEPLNVEAYHNRGAVFERLGKPDAGDRRVPRGRPLQPAYEPSRQALVRLTRQRRRRTRRRTTRRRRRHGPRRGGEPGRRAAATTPRPRGSSPTREKLAPQLRARLPVPSQRRLPRGDRRARHPRAGAGARARARQRALPHQPRAAARTPPAWASELALAHRQRAWRRAGARGRLVALFVALRAGRLPDDLRRRQRRAGGRGPHCSASRTRPAIRSTSCSASSGRCSCRSARSPTA